MVNMHHAYMVSHHTHHTRTTTHAHTLMKWTKSWTTKRTKQQHPLPTLQTHKQWSERSQSNIHLQRHIAYRVRTKRTTKSCRNPKQQQSNVCLNVNRCCHMHNANCHKLQSNVRERTDAQKTCRQRNALLLVQWTWHNITKRHANWNNVSARIMLQTHTTTNNGCRYVIIWMRTLTWRNVYVALTQQRTNWSDNITCTIHTQYNVCVWCFFVFIISMHLLYACGEHIIYTLVVRMWWRCIVLNASLNLST